MLDAARIDLSKYRLERSGEMLKTARRDLDAGDTPPQTIALITASFMPCVPRSH